jgi:hypothetical protein
MQSQQAIRHIVHAAVVTFLCATAAAAQSVRGPAPHPVSLSGPRLGATVMSSGIGDTLRENMINVGPVVSQFGWQFEKRFKTGANGLSVLNEWVLLGRRP